MNTELAETGKKAAPRWMWISLISSLGLNLLIVGVVAGTAWSWRHGGHWGRHGFGGPMSSYLRTLPDERRDEIRKSIRAHFSETRPLWKSVRAARNNVSESLKIEPFDPVGFEDAMKKLRQTEFDARKAMTPILSEIAAKLTPAERQKFLKHHSRHHQWRRNSHRPSHRQSHRQSQGQGGGSNSTENTPGNKDGEGLTPQAPGQ